MGGRRRRVAVATAAVVVLVSSLGLVGPAAAAPVFSVTVDDTYPGPHLTVTGDGCVPGATGQVLIGVNQLSPPPAFPGPMTVQTAQPAPDGSWSVTFAAGTGESTVSVTATCEGASAFLYPPVTVELHPLSPRQAWITRPSGSEASAPVLSAAYPGAPVTLVAGGCGSDGAGGTVSVHGPDGAALAEGVANGAGTVALALTVPESAAPGSYAVAASCTLPDPAASFGYDPVDLHLVRALAVTPGPVGVAGVLTVSGEPCRGWSLVAVTPAAGGDAVVRVDVVPANGAVVDEQGWTIRFVVPASTVPGPYTLSANCSFGGTAVAGFSYKPVPITVAAAVAVSATPAFAG